ncbi:MAG: SOS response-associated peptidase [Gammaproteobacteria bacterium]|nr:MAG: SOS response-associated peptidase [Gammaproteobacteria bacterium]
MCGRFTLSSSAEVLEEYFELDSAPQGLMPRYNIAPAQAVAIIRQVEGLGRHMDSVRWGLIPSWSKEAAIGHHLINARAETVAEKPSFRAAFKRRRCLVPADGFYEWKPVHGRKQPYWIGLQDRPPLGLAGLWEHWEDPDSGEHIETCAIITTQANRQMRDIHPRMPVILPKSAYTAWLAVDSPADVLHDLLLPYPEPTLISYPVSRSLNNPQNDTQELLLPVDAEQ